MTPRQAESLVCGLLGLAGLVVALATPRLIAGHNPSQPYYLQSAFFPWIALTLVAVFGLIGAIQSLVGVQRTQSDEIEAGDSNVALGLWGMLIFGLSILVSLALGYAAAIWITAMAWGWLVRIRRATLLMLSCTLAVTLYGIFVYGFRVWFPTALILG
jgi:hypothetical protein